MSIVTIGRWLWDSETGEFFEPMVGAKGSVSTPPPTPEETALQKKQLELLNAQQIYAAQQAKDQETLAPFLYAQMGLKRTADPTRDTQITDLTTKLRAAQAEYAKLPKDQDRRVVGYEQRSDGGRGNAEYPVYAPAIRDPRTAAKQAEIQSLSAQLEKIQNSPINYTYTKMTPEELRAQMSPEEQQSADIRMLANERTKKALEGNLDVDPSVEADIQRGQDQLRQQLLQKLGPGAEGSDSWNRAMAEFDRNMNALRYSVRYGEMTSAEAIATNRINQNMQRQEQALGNLKESTSPYQVSAGMLAGANQGMESALTRFYNMRMGEAGIRSQNEANKGALVGAGVGAAGVATAAAIAI